MNAPALELTQAPVSDGYDITRYLTPGVQYDHTALKLAYYAACNDFNGTMFRLDVERGMMGDQVYVTWDHPEHLEADFFHAVIASHDRGLGYPEKEKDIVPGYLMLVGDIQW